MEIKNLDSESRRKLLGCQEAIGYHFQNPILLYAALTHSSGAATPEVSNERLEFLGDAVLGLLVVEMLYHHSSTMMEGEMTQIKSVVVSRASCSKISKSLGLGRYLFLGKGMEQTKRLPDSLLANVQESVIGAIFLDGGMEAAKEYVLEYFGPEIDANVKGDAGKNYKTLLQQYVQQQLHQSLGYHVKDERGPDHNKCFKISVRVGKRYYQSAWGKTKKEAEQRAAHNALNQILGQLPPYPSDDD